MYASGALLGANLALKVTEQLAILGRELEDNDLEPATLNLIKYGKSLNAEACAKASQINHVSGRIMGRFHEKYDAILSPTMASLPVSIGEFRDGDVGAKLGEFMGDTSLFNQTGQPSISLPLAWSDDGLPIGIMFSAAFGNDALLFQIAGQLEQAKPWIGRKAPHHVNN